jgi:hypothetical protein
MIGGGGDGVECLCFELQKRRLGQVVLGCREERKRDDCDDAQRSRPKIVIVIGTGAGQEE